MDTIKKIKALPDDHVFEASPWRLVGGDFISQGNVEFNTDDLKALVQRLEQAELDRLAYMKYVHGVASLDFSSVPIEFHGAVVRIGNELQAYLKEREATNDTPNP